MKETKYIFVTGGVVSGLGKGVSAASLGRLLKARGFKIFVQKLDPYYNTDPGTMSPYQHGEVYVTSDGAETDLDLGHYERFIDEKFSQESNYTQGKILFELLNEEREGKFNGNTVQVIPHVTNKIQEKIKKAEKVSHADFVITEIGGIIGDIESRPFAYAIAKFARKHKNKCFFIHTTFIPYLEAGKEFKSKPTQQSIALMQSFGIVPDMILLRSNKNLPQKMVKKVADKTLIEFERCIPVPTVDNIYKVPLHFEKFRMAQIVLEHFGIEQRDADLNDWKDFVEMIKKDKKITLNIAMVGKYVEFEDAYKSIVEALKITGVWRGVKLKLKWIQSENLTKENITEELEAQDGVIILPGFGQRGFEGKVVAAKYTRDNDIPTFGICYGFQAMVVNQAHEKGIMDATSSEIMDKGSFVIDIIRGKSKDDKVGGTLRLGEMKTIHKKGSLVEKLYNSTEGKERHRHRYEVNPEFIEQIETEEFVFSGYSKDNGLAEVCEAPKLKFYLGLQAHPEFNARPLKSHPLFDGFIDAVIKDKR